MSLPGLKFLFATFILSTAFISCEKESPLAKNGIVFFQHEYKNYAWGISHSGWFIDSLGNVRFYNLPSDWKEADNDGYISEDDLMSNLQSADSILYQLSLNELNGMVSLIDNIDERRIQVKVRHIYDAGDSSLYYYSWDAQAAKYKRVLIWGRGYYSEDNIGVSAQQLIEKLKVVGGKAGYFVIF